MIENDNSLQMTFYLKQDKDFLSEYEVIEAIKTGKKLPINGSTTDGAISILYYGRELLGTYFWDEIYWEMHDLIYAFDKLEKGESISTFFGMQSCWLTLIPNGKYLKYQFKSATDKREVDIQESIPFDLFTREFALVIWRMIKILNHLGANFDEALENWRELPLSKTAKKYQEEIRQIIEADIIDL